MMRPSFPGRSVSVGSAGYDRVSRSVIFRLALGLVLFGVSACGQFTRSVEPTPTLVATLDLGAMASETPILTLSPVQSSTLEPSPDRLAETPTPSGSPTSTITAWPNSTATNGPSPTPSRTATITRIPTRTRAPTNTPTITLTPTITFTPTPPEPEMYLVRPGLMSKVLSPIQMEIYAVSGPDGKVTVELVGEDGRVISRQIIDHGKSGPRRFWMVTDLPFEIDAVAEIARLQVSALDTQSRLLALSSVDVLLLSVGRSEINPAAVTQEAYLIRRPEAGEVIQGGVLVIDALARPVNDSPLFIELVNEAGTVISVKQVAVPAPSGQLSHTPFSVEIPYKVNETTPVRLIIRQEGSRIPGTVASVSQEIVLEP